MGLNRTSVLQADHMNRYIQEVNIVELAQQKNIMNHTKKKKKKKKKNSFNKNMDMY